MADNQAEDIGKYARHPRRTAGAAFLIGMGTAVMASRMRSQRQKTGFSKFMDR